MSPAVSYVSSLPSRFPRVSGDEPQGSIVYNPNYKFSPRERG